MRSAPEETRTVAAGGDGWADLDGSLRAVAVEVLRHGPLPRAALSRRLGLSPGSLTRLTRPLLDAGLLVEGGPQLQSRTGRPSVPLDVRTGRERFAGVKVTGDELFAVLTDLRLLEVARPAFDDALAAEPGGPPVPVQAVPFGFADWARGAAVVAVQERVLGRSA